MTDTTELTRRVVIKMVIVVIAMFGFGFAMVPLYDVICEITGINGKTGVVDASKQTMQADLSREVTVKFVTSVNQFAPWEFKASVTTMTVNPGAIYETMFYARNKTKRLLAGQAVPSVVPREASLYFSKTECFCFTRQNFEAGEEKEMPVKFIIDPALPAHVETVVLSYTFFDVSES